MRRRWDSFHPSINCTQVCPTSWTDWSLSIPLWIGSWFGLLFFTSKRVIDWYIMSWYLIFICLISGAQFDFSSTRFPNTPLLVRCGRDSSQIIFTTGREQKTVWYSVSCICEGESMKRGIIPKIWYFHASKWQDRNMMTSSNGNIFHANGPLWGEFTGHRWIHVTKASDAELWFF